MLRKLFATATTASAAALVPSAVPAMAGQIWPNLPVGIKNGIAARVGDTVYVGLGSAGADLYSLNLHNPASGWIKRAPFVGPTTNGAAVAASGDTIYVFSGNGKADPAAVAPIIFDTVYAYDTRSDAWRKMNTKTPVGLSGGKAIALSDGQIAIVGGYNKQLFDKYVSGIAGIDKEKNPEVFKTFVNSYMSMKPEDYRWNAKVLSFDPNTNQWGSFGDNPYLPNCDSAIISQGDNAFTLVGGEIKPGLRTPDAKSVTIRNQTATWQKLPALPKPMADARQEGVAGAFAGSSSGTILVAGGANFKGAQSNADAGKWFTHDGIAKRWREEVYAFDGRDWKEVGNLPHGLAYGASFSMPNGMLIVGGEDKDGEARREVFLLNWNGRALSIEE